MDVADAQTLLVLGILYVDHPTALDTLGEHGDGGRSRDICTACAGQ